MSEVSKEELIAFTEAHSKSAVALERITETLENITQKQDKIIDKMSNGLSEVIIRGIVDNYASIHKETVADLIRIECNQKDIKEAILSKIPEVVSEKLTNSGIAKDLGYIKWFIGIVGMVIIVATVILKLMGASVESRIATTQAESLQKMLQEYKSITIKP